MGQPGSEGYRLTSYATMKTLAETYSVLRTCLERRKNEIRALEWDIALTPDAANAYQGKPSAMRDFGERKAKAVKFFKRPDSDYDDFGSWLFALTDQLFVYDAVSIYLCPKKGTGLRRGLLGSDLDELWVVDGSSIRPLAGLHGERPRPPAPAYQQYEFGVPRADFTVIEAGLDLDGSEGRLRASLRGDQLSYRPYLRRPDSPYGFSLVEQALIPVMTGLRKQAFQLDYFNESSVPRVWLSPGDATMTATQIRELQDAINSVAGDLAWAFKVMVIPPNSKVIPQKDMQIVDDSDNWIATEVAMVCDLSPVELGMIPRVSAAASPFAAREMAQAARSIHERTATKPTLAYLAAIPDMILQRVCGQEDMRFIFDGMEQTQDLAALTDMGIKQVQSGVKTIDEFRDDLHMTRFNLPETRSPVVFTQLGPIPLAQASASAQAQRQEVTGTQAAGEGHLAASPQRKALPAGTSGQGRMNGPVTQRQARRGGALAPAHATGEGAPGRSGGKPAPKAVLAELGALERHLNKGMPAAEWVPEHIPGDVMAIIAEDLGKGLSAGYVCKAAAASLGLAARQHHPTPQQQRQAQLAAQYQQQVQQAFAQAVAQAQALIAQWVAGTLAVTAAVLAGMIAELIRLALLPVLMSLWAAAWDAAVTSAGGDPARFQAELEAFLATEGQGWASLISGTGSAALLAAITQALRAGDAGAVMDLLSVILNVDVRSEQIAVSEVTRAWNAGLLAWMKLTGLGWKIWRNRGDAKVCQGCRDKTAMGPLPADAPYPGGAVAPPGHTLCRCWLELVAEPALFTGKVLRREVGLNGQETWVDREPGFDYSGGRVLQPHRADGVMEGGGEPPRWDGSEQRPATEHEPDADDDAAYGGDRGTGTVNQVAWPMPWMDGWWPQPHGHGMQQPPASSPGAATGRPPNAAGKASKPSKAATFLKGAPKAKASDVRAVMSKNFPASALGWVGKIKWCGPVELPVSLLDLANEPEWAASHETGHVDELARQISANQHVNPVIGVIRAGHSHVRLIDGRHRTLACKKLGRPVTAYVGWLDDANEKAAYDTYHQQFHAGDSPENKSFTAGNLGIAGAVHGLVPVGVQQGEKLTKAVVNYRPAADLAVSCGTCSMLEPDGSCSLVEGCIATSDVCDRWEPRDRNSVPGYEGSQGPFRSQYNDPHVYARDVHSGAGNCVCGGDLDDALHVRSPLAAKSLGAAYCAGLLVRAQDTGRVLLIQRALADGDPGAGFWEIPGGHQDDGETLLQAALREFAEEVGHPVPAGELTGHWESPNGIYRAFVLTIPREGDLELGAPREVDNPDGDAFEACAFFDPRQLGGNPAIRTEVRADLPLLLDALDDGVSKSAETPVVSTVHHPLGHEGLWHTPSKKVPERQQLPAYVQNTAAALMRDHGMGRSQAIATAINAIREWAAGRAFGGRVKVTSEVRAAASAALAEWERLKESHHQGETA